MNNKIAIALALICLVVIYLIVNGINVPLTSQRYIVNIYMYVLLAITTIGLTWAFLDNCEESFIDNYVKNLGLVLVFFISFIVIAMSPTDYTVLNHAAWMLFVVSTGFMTYLTYKNNIETNVMPTVLLSLVAIVATMSYIAYSQPPETFNSWEKPLAYSLGILIIVEIADLIFFRSTEEGAKIDNRLKIYSWIGLIIFSLLMITGTTKIIKNSELNMVKCAAKTQLECVDYPKESLQTVLNIANLFNMASGGVTRS